MNDQLFDCIVIGGGQSALACAYYLRRSNLNYILLDANTQSGGSWSKHWDSLTLFSPAKNSSLPGWPMPDSQQKFPAKNEVIDYLEKYEKRYTINIQRNIKVLKTHDEGNHFRLETNRGAFRTATVISATGTFSKPYIPKVKGIENFKGTQLHSSAYKTPEKLIGQKVLIVGEGNTGAQILSEVAEVTQTFWAVKNKPEFLPEDVDGSVLFDAATAMYYAKKSGKKIDTSVLNLGNIVLVPTVKKAKELGVFNQYKRIMQFDETHLIWQDGSKEKIDAIIWCTGFEYATDHLAPTLEIGERGKVETEGTKAAEVDGIWLVGYGGWTGFASATLIGVGRTARSTVKEIEAYLGQ